MSKKRILLGIATWNEKEDILLYLEHLKSFDMSDVEIVVVDNGSTDGTGNAIVVQFPHVTLLVNKDNRGAAGGRNTFFEYFIHKTDADYLLISDPDVLLPPNCFETLIEEIEMEPNVGIVGLKAYFSDRSKIYWSKGGARYNHWFGRFEGLGQGEEDAGQYDMNEDVDSVPAGFTFVKREVVEKVSEMEEKYFIYFEESDWNFAVLKAGYRIITSKAVKVVHKVSSSLGMESPLFYYYRTRNNLLFAVRQSPWYVLPFFMIYFHTYRLFNVLLTLYLSKQYSQMKGVLYGIIDFYRGKFFQCTHKFS